MRMQRYVLSSLVMVGVLFSGRVASATEVTIAPTSHDFGQQTLSSNTDFIFVVDKGGGPSPTNVTFTESGTGCAHFAIVSPTLPIATLGGATDVTVRFTPTTTGSKTCTFTESAGADGDANVDTFVATGVGGIPVMTTTVNTNLTFGNVHIGGTAPTRTVNIANSGDGVLNWAASITAGGPPYTVFPAGGSIVAGGNTNVTVTYTPTARVLTNGNLQITGDAPANPSDDHAITGTGTSPDMVVTWTGSPGVLDYGSIAVPSGSASKTLTITNSASGNENLNWSVAVTTLGTDYTAQAPTSGTNLAPGNAVTVDVVFDPTTQGTRIGQVTVTGNDGVSGNDLVDLTGDGTTKRINISPASMSFGTVKIPNATANQTATITNPGFGTNLSISRLQITGTGASNFEFTSNGCAGQDCQPGSPYIILPGGVDTETFNIRCNPALPAGAYAPNLVITSNADSGTSSIPLTCTGTAPDINVPTTTVSFGNRTVSGSPHQLTFTIQNTSAGAGSETMDYTMALTGTGAAAYSLSPACATTCTLTAGSTQTVTVNFSPSARIAYAGLVTINADDPDEQGVNAPTVTLSGTGIAPVIGNISPASQTLAFGLIDVGTNSGNLTASIQNTGDSPLNISAVTLTGTNPGQFTIVSGTVGSHQIAINGSDSWQVRCNPTSIGDKTANLHIASDALGAATFDFALTCTGQQAIFSFSPIAGLDFGSIFVGQVGGPTPVTINNIGNKSGTVSSIVSGNAAFTFTTVGGPTLAPSGSMTVNVTFTPVNGNNITTQLTVNTDGNPASFPIPLHGDGKTEGQNVTIAGETDLDVTLGNIRVGNTVTKVVTVQNEGDTGFTLAIPSSTSGECVVQPVSPALPAVIAGGGVATFNINVTPADLGASTCTITVQSVTQGPGGATNTDTIDVSFSGVAPDVTVVAPADFSLEFNGVDVDSAPVMQVVQVQNSGDFPLTISGCSVSPPGRFAVVTNCATPFTVAIGDTTSVQVSYDPSVEALDAANLVLNVDAFSGPTVQIALSGVGVDQNITLPALHYDFPDTYRNPDPDQTPTVNVVVQNPANATTGFGADLHVSMTMVNQTTEGVYVVSDTSAVTVAPDATGEIPVEFHPTAAPALFEGTLVIVNDDTGDPMAEVTMSGNGISRNVAVTPNNFDLMTTGVGVPVHLSDLTEGGIVVQNMATDDFTVRELQFVDSNGVPIDSDAFVILDGDEPRDLTAGAHEDFDIEFAPLESGEYEILVAIYLDNDPLAQSQVQLRGRAVDVELHGGGGCAAGGGGGGWGALVLGAAAVLGLRRRSTRAASRRSLTVSGLVGLGLVLVAAPAFADPTRNIDITTFAPAPATEVDGFQVESPVIGVNGAWALDLTVNHATNPLTATSAEIDGMTDRPVSARTGLQLAFAYAFLDEFEAGVRIPFYSSSGEDPQFSGLQPANGSTLGDVAAHVKARLFASGGLAGAASLDVTVPTAKDDQYAGVSGPAAQIRVLGGWRNPRMGATANVGFVARGAGDLADITQGNAVTFGAGGSYRALESLWVIGEAFGASGMGSKGPGVKQLEGVLGVRYQLGRTIGVSVGGGRGILTGIGSPDIRAFAMVDVSPRARPEKPLFVRKPPPPRDTRDDDGDRIVNADDTCKSDAEDEDGFKDDDGCPELDNDEDGALDTDDKCPIEAEDKDGFQDEDGCIDADNDGDKVPDVDDKCPMEVEDFDGYNDNDGCDEPDNDSDGIPDVIDQCALEQETINGKNDDDGCPDNGDSAVMVMPDRIEIFEPVLFDGTSAKLSKKSANVLGQVAATLRANRDFKRIRVTVHVHPRDDNDDSLSTKRAKAVEAWLVKWGIEPERLDAKGMGSSRPLVKKDKKGAAALNDRVEFIILEKDVGQ